MVCQKSIKKIKKKQHSFDFVLFFIIQTDHILKKLTRPVKCTKTKKYIIKLHKIFLKVIFTN